MICPACGSADYFELVSKDCGNPDCEHYNKGTTRPSSVTTRKPSAHLEHYGFVLLHPDRTFPQEEYVFKTKEDGEKWAQVNGKPTEWLREVLSPKSFKWLLSRGTVRGITLADQLYLIYPKSPNELPNRPYAMLYPGCVP